MEKETKAFQISQPNGFYLQFPNGNCISTIWGQYSHTENYDYKSPNGIGEGFKERLGSNDAECMVSADKNTVDRIKEKFKDNLDWYEDDSGKSALFNNITITQWVEMINTLNTNN